MEHPEGERLQKVLARAGLGSRRAVEELIAAGRVKVNGKRAELGRRVDVTKDKVEVDGSSVPLDVDLAHYLLNKPVGVVTTASDPEGRETVLDIVDLERRVWPVGRLDIDSEGALILTNDGDLTHALTHPSFEVPKTYVAEVSGSVGYKVLRMLSRGVELEDGHARATNVALVERTAGGALLEITVTEGRHRLVRRMCEATGHPVKQLVRTSIGPLKLGRLKAGSWRRINPEELRELYRACGL
ncbi:MAG TPA: pseudouridine synthase [Actinomycetota bacterium]|nr:pseudouridine synthase [Actinomycetota bacterium]